MPTRPKPHRVLAALLTGLAALVLTGCAHEPPAPPEGATACPTPRPQMCTRDYRPVVGFDVDGHHLGSYGNHCSACGDDRVRYTLPESRD